MSDIAEIKVDGKTIELPVITGTEDEKAIDISKLRDLTGFVTLDTGFKNTGSTKSAITYLDGEQGILRYRGYPIEQLAEKSSFLEVAYLLIYGRLPIGKQLEDFQNRINEHTLVPEDIKKFFDGFPSNAHPMGQLGTIIGSLSVFYPESQDQHASEEEVDLTIIKLLAKMPTIVSWIYKKGLRHQFFYQKNKLYYVKDIF
jgi:citrate synthase